MRMSLCLFRVAALLLIPLLAVSPRAVAGFIPTLYNLSDEDSHRLEAAAKAAAAMSDEQRRKTIDVDIPKYIKGSSGDGLLVLLAILLVGGAVLGAALGGSSSHCDDDDYNHNRYCCP